MENNQQNEPKDQQNEIEQETIKTVTAHFQNQLDEEKKKHKEEITKLKQELENEKQRHIQDIRDILTAGKIQIPQDDKPANEEETVLNNLRERFNLKGDK